MALTRAEVEQAAAVTIPLVGGKLLALIDAEDYALVAPYRWYLQRNKWALYAQAWPSNRQGGRVHLVMHRLIVGAQPGEDVDHQNFDGLDNRRRNLRVCTRSQNKANGHKYATCRGRIPSSRFKGVSFSRSTEQWQARLTLRGKQLWLGYFATQEAAAHAYDAAALEYFGEFARLNFPQPELPMEASG